MKFTQNLVMAGAGLAMFSTALTAAPATAANVTAPGGMQYTITTVTDSYNDISALLQSQPWWTNNSSNSVLAEDFAGQVAAALGTNNSPSNPFDEGPYFAFALNNFSVDVANWDLTPGIVETDDDSNAFDEDFIWAVTEASVAPAPAAAAVPTPALLPAMLGMGASIIRKRKKQAEAAA